MKFRVVEELAIEQADVNRCCDVFGVSRSGYYGWLRRPLSARKTEDQRLWEKIKKLWEDSRKTYGSPRIFRKLRAEGDRHSRKRVARIMREKGIRAEGRKKGKVQTTDSRHAEPIAARVFKVEDADTQVTAPNQFWAGDITYIPTDEGWLYLSAFLDLCTRKVVGHSTDETMSSGLVLRSLDQALIRQGIKEGDGLTTHTDRGVQYASEVYRSRLEQAGITASMSRKGNCYDNAFVESFFKTLKVELVYRKPFKTRKEARLAIFEFIETWYNRQRIHSSIDYMSPVDYETQHLAA